MGTALLEHVLTLKMQQEQGEMSKGTIRHIPSLKLTFSPLKMGRAPIQKEEMRLPTTILKKGELFVSGSLLGQWLNFKRFGDYTKKLVSA